MLNKESSNRGYLFEVDLEYPENLWEVHNDNPLAPEKLYHVLHYENLKQYLSLGMKLTAVHR